PAAGAGVGETVVRGAPDAALVAAVLPLGEDVVRAGRVHEALEAVGAQDLRPAERTALGLGRAVVLRAAQYLVHVPGVHGAGVELGDGQVERLLPRTAREPVEPAVVPEVDVARAERIDPQRVMVDVDRAGDVAQRRAAVERVQQAHAAGPDVVGVDGRDL